MPTYDYVCSNCGHELEAFHPMSAEPLKTCPECGKEALQKQLGTGAGIVFKGSGFYQTDYKNPPKSEGGKKGGDGDGGGGGKDKSESKPKPESKPEKKKESTAKKD